MSVLSNCDKLNIRNNAIQQIDNFIEAEEMRIQLFKQKPWIQSIINIFQSIDSWGIIEYLTTQKRLIIEGNQLQCRALTFSEIRQAKTGTGVASAKKIAEFCIKNKVLGQQDAGQSRTVQLAHLLRRELTSSRDGTILYNQVRLMDLNFFGQEAFEYLLRSVDLQEFLFSYRDSTDRSLLQIQLDDSRSPDSFMLFMDKKTKNAMTFLEQVAARGYKLDDSEQKSLDAFLEVLSIYTPNPLKLHNKYKNCEAVYNFLKENQIHFSQPIKTIGEELKSAKLNALGSYLETYTDRDSYWWLLYADEEKGYNLTRVLVGALTSEETKDIADRILNLFIERLSNHNLVLRSKQIEPLLQHLEYRIWHNSISHIQFIKKCFIVLENTLFTTRRRAGYAYKLKNLRIQVEEQQQVQKNRATHVAGTTQLYDDLADIISGYGTTCFPGKIGDFAIRCMTEPVFLGYRNYEFQNHAENNEIVLNNVEVDAIITYCSIINYAQRSQIMLFFNFENKDKIQEYFTENGVEEAIYGIQADARYNMQIKGAGYLLSSNARDVERIINLIGAPIRNVLEHVVYW